MPYKLEGDEIEPERYEVNKTPELDSIINKETTVADLKATLVEQKHNKHLIVCQTDKGEITEILEDDFRLGSLDLQKYNLMVQETQPTIDEPIDSSQK